MSNEIEDGTGSGNRVKVDKDKRFHTQSLAIPYDDFVVLDGDSFAITSGIQVLTTANRSDLIYFSNDGEEDLVLSRAQFDMGSSTGGTNLDWKFYIVVLDPLPGTIVTPAVVLNNNLASSKTLTVTGFTGTEGTLASLGFPVPFLLQGEGTRFRTQKLVLPKGSSLVFGIQPPTGNTSVEAQIGVTLIKQTLDLD